MKYREILEACWKGYHKEGMKTMFGKRYPNCVKNTNEELEEDLRKWFKEKWVRFGPDGKIRGDCARGDDSEGKPKCLPQSKAHGLGKKGRASAAARKRREDPNPERSGPAINVNTKKKSNEDTSSIDFDMQFDDDTGSFATVTARAQGRTLGSVKFFMDGDTLEADMVEVDERYRGQGIAAAMYDYAKSQGYTIEKSSDLTPDGDHFWNKNRGEEPVWEQGMAENFADGKKPGRKGLAKRVGVNCKQPVSKLRSIAANSSGERQRMAHWCANMKSGKKK